MSKQKFIPLKGEEMVTHLRVFTGATKFDPQTGKDLTEQGSRILKMPYSRGLVFQKKAASLGMEVLEVLWDKNMYAAEKAAAEKAAAEKAEKETTKK